MLSHKVIRLIVAFAIGISLSVFTFRVITDPEPVQVKAQERAKEEAAVFAARDIVRDYVSLPGQRNIVDPLAPNRAVGKAYVYLENDGWQVSGYYRRTDGDRWHPYLITLTAELALSKFSVRDDNPALVQRATTDSLLDIRP